MRFVCVCLAIERMEMVPDDPFIHLRACFSLRAAAAPLPLSFRQAPPYSSASYPLLANTLLLSYIPTLYGQQRTFSATEVFALHTFSGPRCTDRSRLSQTPSSPRSSACK